MCLHQACGLVIVAALPFPMAQAIMAVTTEGTTPQIWVIVWVHDARDTSEGHCSLSHERMAEHHPCKDDAAGVVVALANLPGLARFRSEVNATTIEAALGQALVEPLPQDLRGAALMRSVEQQNLVCV